MKYWPLILKNLTRNKLRTFLTGAAIALSVALVCLLMTMPAGFDAVLESVSKNTRIAVHAKAGLAYPLPASYLRKVQAAPGVVDATAYVWFGGVFDRDKGVTFPNFAVDPEKIPIVFEDRGIDPKVLEDFASRRDAALVGGQTLERYGWEVGDRISLQSTIFGGLELDFQIVGRLPGQDPVFWFQREYLEQAIEALGAELGDIGMIWARVDDAGRVDEVMQQIDTTFRNSEVETSTETEKMFVANFFSVLEGLIVVILIVTALVALCIVFIAANTASMSVRERLGELAIMKALGFRARTIFGMLMVEATLLSTVAGAAGALASLALTASLRSAAELGPQMGLLGGFVVTNAMLVQMVFLSLFVGMLSGVVPSFGAARRSVVVTLREVF